MVGPVVHQALRPISPMQGFVELDARRLASVALSVARAALDAGGPVEGVGIANQRATTIVWDRASGEPVGPGIGWQDLRTVGICLALAAEGIRVAPNASATKLVALLDMADPGRSRDLCFGTVDTWLAWTLAGGAGVGGEGNALHITDATNAGVTGLVETGAGDIRWSAGILEALRIPPGVMPAIVDSSGIVGMASALPGSPPIAGIAGDQQASLIGQGCTRAGLAKATFGTGGMLDCCIGPVRPSFETRGPAGTFPVVAWQRAGRVLWGVEAVMLSAGSAVDWLVKDLAIIASAAESDSLAGSCPDTGDLWFVPALFGLGAPVWDFGARGTLIGITQGTGRAEVVRAVLEGIAHRGADLVESAEADSGQAIEALRVDGGMSANATFLQLLADATGRPIEVSPVLEATTLGAAYLAGMALGIWADEEELASRWAPRVVVKPRRRVNRDRWLEARARAERSVPELSSLRF